MNAKVQQPPQLRVGVYMVVVWLMILALSYLILANVVFAFRHPWATHTERSLWIGKALTFQKVPYKEMLPRE